MVALVRLRAYWRFLVVFYRFLPLLVAWTRDRRRFLLFGGSRRVDAATRRERAEVLLDALLTLGPTFIKLGQLLSTRPDVLPREYIDALSELQDQVPPAPWSEAEAVIEAELGPVEDVFDEFDREAISGASLGQVYTATYDGDPVAVKVRRPGIEELVEADLQVIRWSVPVLVRLIDDARSFSLRNLADEFAKTIREEMDYRRERRMLVEIGGNFADSDRVIVPDAVGAASSGRVFTMEYVEGTKVTDLEGLAELGVDRTELATTLQEAYLQMIVEDGVFHADPHPGNLAVREDGAIVFYDFGMSGRVDPFIQEKIVEFYVAVANQNIDAILDALVEMGTLSPEADREVMGEVMELAIADARGQEIEQYRVQQIVEQLESTMYEFPLRLPRNLALVLRVATVVEGVCVTLDPEFDFIEVATNYLTEQGYREEGVRQLVEGAGEQLQDTTRALFTVPPKLDRTLDRLQRGNVTVNVHLEDRNEVFDRLAQRLAYAILVAVGALSTAILFAFDQTGPLSAAVAALLTLPALALLYRSFRGDGGVRAQPQFTRQNLREQEDAAAREPEATEEADGDRRRDSLGR